jgi:MoaA/NifB/PqqE/SkfB family radical SAM enzyme
MNHILFPITYACNLSCAGCCAKSAAIVDIDKSLETIMSKAGEIEWVYITGGEPFTIPNLSEICDTLKDKGFKVGVTTNGTFYRPEIADHVDRIGISLDGPREYHDAYRGEGVFDSATKLFNAVKEKCETVIMSVAFKENLEELKKLSPIIELLNPTYWQIQRDMNDPSLVIPNL